VVLEVTAKDQDGRTLFSEHRTYQEIGVDIERRMQFGAWLIKEIIDFTLAPLETRRERYLIHFDTDTREALVEARLWYYLSADQGQVVDSFRQTLRFPE